MSRPTIKGLTKDVTFWKKEMHYWRGRALLAERKLDHAEVALAERAEAIDALIGAKHQLAEKLEALS
jgi:hypothetical protein